MSPFFYKRLVLVAALASSTRVRARPTDTAGGLLARLTHLLPHEGQQHGEPLSNPDEHSVPGYTWREHWPVVPSINAYPGIAPLPERCKQPHLPRNETTERAPSGALTGECFQLDLRGPHETQPVLPTLFIPGFPKAATTWLFDCIYAAFKPETVCPLQKRDFEPRKWSREGCGQRRYLLTGIACHVLGGCSPRKELFFYGGGFSELFQKGLAGLHGPELPLEMFASVDRKSGGRWAPKLATDAVKLQRMKAFCSHPNHTHLPAGRNHPSCCTSVATEPKRWECRWHNFLRQQHGLVQSVWFHTAMPWVKPNEFDFATIDATPNYMCTPAALANIKRSAARPADLRFVVVMRDPIMRAFSEWSMFALGWGWERDPDFTKKMRAQMEQLRTCNATLFHRNDLLHALPDAELFAYVARCFSGKAMQYVTNSIYPVCVLAALRIFIEVLSKHFPTKETDSKSTSATMTSSMSLSAFSCGCIKKLVPEAFP